mgnify:CR=1 FL=1
MLNSSLTKVDRLDRLIRKHGKKGLRLLIIFKLLKMEIMKKLKRRHLHIKIDEKQLNDICIRKAAQIIKRGGDNPTEKDIKYIISRLLAV